MGVEVNNHDEIITKLPKSFNLEASSEQKPVFIVKSRSYILPPVSPALDKSYGNPYQNSENDTAQQYAYCPLSSGALSSPEMLNAVPPLVAPCPLISLHPEHNSHDKAGIGNKSQ